MDGGCGCLDTAVSIYGAHHEVGSTVSVEVALGNDLLAGFIGSLDRRRVLEKEWLAVVLSPHELGWRQGCECFIGIESRHLLDGDQLAYSRQLASFVGKSVVPDQPVGPYAHAYRLETIPLAPGLHARSIKHVNVGALLIDQFNVVVWCHIGCGISCVVDRPKQIALILVFDRIARKVLRFVHVPSHDALFTRQSGFWVHAIEAFGSIGPLHHKVGRLAGRGLSGTVREHPDPPLDAGSVLEYRVIFITPRVHGHQPFSVELIGAHLRERNGFDLAIVVLCEGRDADDRRSGQFPAPTQDPVGAAALVSEGQIRGHATTSRGHTQAHPIVGLSPGVDRKLSLQGPHGVCQGLGIGVWVVRVWKGIMVGHGWTEETYFIVQALSVALLMMEARETPWKAAVPV